MFFVPFKNHLSIILNAVTFPYVGCQKFSLAGFNYNFAWNSYTAFKFLINSAYKPECQRAQHDKRAIVYQHSDRVFTIKTSDFSIQYTKYAPYPLKDVLLFVDLAGVYNRFIAIADRCRRSVLRSDQELATNRRGNKSKIRQIRRKSLVFDRTQIRSSQWVHSGMHFL